MFKLTVVQRLSAAVGKKSLFQKKKNWLAAKLSLQMSIYRFETSVDLVGFSQQTVQKDLHRVHAKGGLS